MFRLRRALRSWCGLPAIERRVQAEALLLLPTVHAAQNMLAFRQWRPLLTRAYPRASAATNAPSPEAIARAVERARRGLPGEYKCLPMAYTAHLLLHWYGHPSQVQVGVSRDASGAVEAHAWVECDGRVLVGDVPELGRFMRFPPLHV